MTGIGKLFVLANLFVSVTLAVWAVSLYANRLNWLDSTTGDGQAVEGRLTAMKKDLARLSADAAATSQLYGQRSANLLNGEAYRQRRVDFYTARLAQARTGDETGGPVFREFDLAGGVGPLIDITRPGTAVRDASQQPLRGLNDIQADLDRSLADAVGYRAAIAKARAEHQKVSADIADLDARADAQRSIDVGSGRRGKVPRVASGQLGRRIAGPQRPPGPAGTPAEDRPGRVSRGKSN